MDLWNELGDYYGFVPVRMTEAPEQIFLHNLRIADILRVLCRKSLRRLPRKALVTEAKIVLPHLHWKIWERFFDEIYWIGRGDDASGGFPCPYPHVRWSEVRVEHRKKDPILVNANKFSATKGELYSLRRACIATFPNIVVAGQGWKKGVLSRLTTMAKEFVRSMLHPPSAKFAQPFPFVRPKNYLGPVADKVATLGGYRCCLVIENSEEYVTEKLLDALVAGCIPIYVGTDLDPFGIPASLYVRSKASVGAVEAAYQKALAIDYEQFLVDLKLWLGSEQAQKHSYNRALQGVFE